MMLPMQREKFKLWWLMPLMLASLVACGGNQSSMQAAPIGDHAVLEQIATAYRGVSQQYPVQPSSMRPAGKKEFVERVFTQAGYHYSATLKAFAKQGMDVTSQDQRDLAELLFLPVKGLSDADMEDLYSEEELLAIRAIKAGLK